MLEGAQQNTGLSSGESPAVESALKVPDYTNQQLLQHYDIKIRFLSVGCIVTVGCKEIPFEDNITALRAIESYVTDTKNAIKYWEEKFSKQ